MYSKGIHLTIKDEAKHEQTKAVRWTPRTVEIMVTYSRMCHEGVGEGRMVVMNNI